MENRGEILRSARKRKKMSSKDLAEAVGVSQAYISALELGKRDGSDLVWEKIAEIVESPVLYLGRIQNNLDLVREQGLLNLAKAILSISEALDLSWEDLQKNTRFELPSDYFKNLKDFTSQYRPGEEAGSMTQTIDEPIVDDLITAMGNCAKEIQTNKLAGSDLTGQRITLPVIEGSDVFLKHEGISDIYEEYASGYLSVPLSALVGPGYPLQPFLFRVKGNNMRGVGIEKGSLILVNPNLDIQNGETYLIRWMDRICVNGLLYLPGGGVEIRSANQDLHPIKVTTDMRGNLNIIGKITRIYFDKPPGNVL